MQNLKSNWLVISKLTWEIWQILTQVLKNPKKIALKNVWGKKSEKELCLMSQKTDAKFEGKLTCAFKIDMMNLANFA